MTDLHHPAIAGLRVARITAKNYGLPDPAPPPPPPLPPERVRQLLDYNPAQPAIGSADAI